MKPSRQFFFREWLGYAGIAIAGLCVSFQLYSISANTIEETAKKKFDYESRRAQLAIETRISDYTDVIAGLKALFETVPSVSRSYFHHYIESLNLKVKFPGIQNFNYAELVSDKDKAAFVERIRKDTSIRPDGYPDFSITPAGTREQYYVLIFSEPENANDGWFGLDIGAHNIVRRALERSRDTGKLVSSGRRITVGSRTSARTALAMRLPLYRPGMPVSTVEQRRAAYFGSVGAGFDIEKLMVGTLDEGLLKRVNYRLYDNGSKTDDGRGKRTPESSLLFESSPGYSEDRRDPTRFFVANMRMEVGGRMWETQFYARKTDMMNESDAYLPWIAFSIVLLFTALLLILYCLLMISNRRAHAIATAMTKDLRESEASLEYAQQIARMGNWQLGPENGMMICSSEACRILGKNVQARKMLYTEFLDRIHEADRKDISDGFASTLVSGAQYCREHRIKLDDGTSRWLSTIAQTATDASATVLRGTIMDITVRKQAELQKSLEHKVTQLIACGLTLDEVASRITEFLCVDLNCDRGFYRTPSKNGTYLECRYTWNRHTTQMPELFVGPIALDGAEDDLAIQAWLSEEPVIIRTASRRIGVEKPCDIMASDRFALCLRVDNKRFGIIECISKDVGMEGERLADLLRVINRQMVQFLQRKLVEDELIYVATHDALTNLPNRSMFYSDVRRLIDESRTKHRKSALMFIDLDRFKLVNDTIGHNAGDKVLQDCTQRLTRSLRDSDVLARLGGDEFALFVPDAGNISEMKCIAERILAALKPPFTIDNTEFMLAASIGISTFPDDGVDVETLLRNADTAMYRAKSEGNSYHFFSTQMHTNTLARFEMESSLRYAILRNELEVYYQPKLDIQSNQISSIEALLRWNYGGQGLIAPDKFISLAEESGLIIEIGNWVLRESCRQVKSWHERGLPTVRVAVNLSARQFNYNGLIHDIAAILDETALPPSSLEIEITESMVIESNDKVVAVLKKLKEMGINLSIDDFGTGYSSLAYLRNLPVDCVKIDRTFIKDIPNDADNMAISKSIIDLGHTLRLKVVAEGVETTAQLSFLKRHGCNEIQGYWFSKPLPAEEMEKFLLNFRTTQIREPILTDYLNQEVIDKSPFIASARNVINLLGK